MSTENIHDGGFNHLLHSVQTATVPGCTTPESIGVAAENLSAAGAFDPTPSELANASARWVRSEGYRRLRETIERIDRQNPTTPKTRIQEPPHA